MSRPAGSGTAAVGPAVVLLGLAPFLVARFLWHPAGGGGVDGVALGESCPLLEHVGVPCAGCGASRALFHFVNGDASFVDYNWFWVLAFLALAGYGLALTARALRGRPLQGPRLRQTVEVVTVRPWVAGVFTLAFLSLAWAVAMLNIASVRGG
jgi:hypothetical protein